MPTEATFRFSTYLTLAFACAALGYAQAPMLPEVPAFAAVAVVALGALYFVETRFALLSIPAANRLGGAIFAAFVLWAGYRIRRELETHEFANMGWDMLIVAMVGPLVLMLLAAKVARGEKHAGDYWWLHGLALAGVGLAAAFAEEPLCFVLVGLYLVAAVWSITLFHLGRAAGLVPPIPDPGAPLPQIATASGDPPGTRTGLPSALWWAALAGAIAVPLYLLTPRSDAPKAEFGKARVEIGYAADQMVDLKRTGTLKGNDQPAFEVTARFPDGTPKEDLDPDQRWRGRTHQQYANGAWNKEPGRLPSLVQTARPAVPWVPPDLGPSRFLLSFELPPRPRAHFVADPVIWLPNEPVPLAGTTEDPPRGWTVSFDGTFFWEVPQVGRRSLPRYVQAYAVRPDPDLGPGFQLAGSILSDTISRLCDNPVERVKEYSDKLLADLIAGGQLPGAWRDPAVLHDPRRRLPREEHYDQLARAFAAHLSTTPTLRYSLELRRENENVDPIEDFLFHSRTGHCERFATALVLMLRAQGIPSVLVLGFKGCTHLGDGKYVVKQENAHAWVDALVSLPVPDTDRRAGGPTRQFHWRGLDPTPSGAEATADANAAWWQQANAWVGARFQQYVLDYTAERRKKELAKFVAYASRTESLMMLGAGAAVLLAARGLLRRRARRAPAAPPPAAPTQWFGELVAVLAAHGIVPAPGDTPMEFALGAGAILRERTGCEAVAEVPTAWAEAYYLERFGGVSISDARRAELGAGLTALRSALEPRV